MSPLYLCWSTSYFNAVVVAIDGPAGSGKSTTARRLAAALGFCHLNSGLLYRAMALAFLRSLDPVPAAEVPRFLREMSLTATCEGGTLVLRLGTEDLAGQLRSSAVTAMASRVALLPSVRAALLREQRALAARYRTSHGIVAEGRDIGTVVFPDAEVKFFLTATLAVRARRRQMERQAMGQIADLASIKAAIAARDRQDTERAHAPLRVADDAFVVHTDDLTIDEQVQVVLAQVRERQRR